MIIPVPHINTRLWQQPRRGDRVYFRLEYGPDHCSPPCVAVYNSLREKLGTFAKSYRHSSTLVVGVKYNQICGYVWMAQDKFILVEIVPRENECVLDFISTWNTMRPNNTPLNN
jgi:hypothetical protein